MSSPQKPTNILQRQPLFLDSKRCVFDRGLSYTIGYLVITIFVSLRLILQPTCDWSSTRNFLETLFPKEVVHLVVYREASIDNTSSHLYIIMGYRTMELARCIIIYGGSNLAGTSQTRPSLCDDFQGYSCLLTVNAERLPVVENGQSYIWTNGRTLLVRWKVSYTAREIYGRRNVSA